MHFYQFNDVACYVIPPYQLLSMPSAFVPVRLLQLAALNAIFFSQQIVIMPLVSSIVSVYSIQMISVKRQLYHLILLLLIPSLEY